MQSDDAKLTAYALGELDEQERAAVAARLEADPAAQRAVEEIRQVAGLLRDELGAEPVTRLAPPQRAALESEAAGAVRPSGGRGRLWLRIGIGAAAAAAVLIATGVALLLIFGRPAPKPDLGPGYKEPPPIGTPPHRDEDANHPAGRGADSGDHPAAQGHLAPATSPARPTPPGPTTQPARPGGAANATPADAAQK
jgi:hypothetical protein